MGVLLVSGLRPGLVLQQVTQHDTQTKTGLIPASRAVSETPSLGAILVRAVLQIA
jgi:hypothetical protein